MKEIIDTYSTVNTEDLRKAVMTMQFMQKSKNKKLTNSAGTSTQ